MQRQQNLINYSLVITNSYSKYEQNYKKNYHHLALERESH